MGKTIYLILFGVYDGKTKKIYKKSLRKKLQNWLLKVAISRLEACKSLGVANKNLSRWVAQAKGTNAQQATKAPESAELLRLKKENQQLKLEREILKKAAAFFANEHK